MKHNLFEGIVEESVPIFGIRKTVINADFKREYHLEFYSFNQQLLTELLAQNVPEAFQFLFDLINTRAARLSNLSFLLEEDDFKSGMVTLNKLPRDAYEKFFEAAFKSGLIENIGSLNGLDVKDAGPLSVVKSMLN